MLLPKVNVTFISKNNQKINTVLGVKMMLLTLEKITFSPIMNILGEKFYFYRIIFIVPVSPSKAT